jgi:hypothetical protein
MEITNDLRFIDARIAEITEAVALLQRNVDKQEWNALDSNLHYVAAKAHAAITKLHAMQAAWVAEMDASN